MRWLFALIFISFPFSTWAQAEKEIEIENPWARVTPPGSKLAAGYMVLRNRGDTPDRLMSAASPLAAKVETHITLKDGNIVRMREIGGYDLPGRGRLELRPGAAHLMFVNIKQPFKEGDKIPLTLRFQRAGEIKVELQVLKTDPPRDDHKH
jgi:periplasmic copper chaperone A